jgi:hypothetical protein
MKRAFIEWKPKDTNKVDLLNKADTALSDYKEQGYRVTLRQLYYHFVAKGWIVNTFRSYKNFGELISQGRLAGYLDWDVIEDRGRRPWSHGDWEEPQSFFQDYLDYYRIDRWERQENYVELWVEKDALAGVLQPVANKHHIYLSVNKGYSSQSAMYEAATRFKYAARSSNTYLLYLGDHDPSGEDMVRDIGDRLGRFGAASTVEKLALTMEQIRQYDPPPNPVKTTDSRAEGYQAEYGDESWELDALEPAVLVSLIEKRLRQLIDKEQLRATKLKELRFKKYAQEKLNEAFVDTDWAEVAKDEDLATEDDLVDEPKEDSDDEE